MLQETLMTPPSTQHLCNFSIVKQRRVYYTLRNTELKILVLEDNNEDTEEIAWTSQYCLNSRLETQWIVVYSCRFVLIESSWLF